MTTPSSAPEQWEEHWRNFAAANRANPGQAYRRQLIFGLLERAGEAATGKLLDIGCGSGDLLADLAARYPDAELAGTDRSATGLQVSRQKVPAAHLAEADFESAATVPQNLHQWATHAVCSEVLEHLADPVAVLHAVKAYLQPGAHLIVTVPGGPMSAFDKEIGHLGHYTAARLRSTLADAGFEPVRVAAAGFPMFNLYRLAVIARGERLSKDIAQGSSGHPSFAARSAMTAFRGLMGLTLTDTPWGWQIIGLGRNR